jgi:hypothetical protein
MDSHAEIGEAPRIGKLGDYDYKLVRTLLKRACASGDPDGCGELRYGVRSFQVKQTNCPVHGQQGIGLVCIHVAHAVDRGGKSGSTGATTLTQLGLMLGAHNAKKPWSHLAVLLPSNGLKTLNSKSFALRAGTRQKRFVEDSAINGRRLTFRWSDGQEAAPYSPVVEAHRSPKRCASHKKRDHESAPA